MRYIENFLSVDDSRALLQWLTSSEDVCWQRESLAIFGKRVAVPRRLCWFGDRDVNYRYTGLDHLATGWPPLLRELRAQVAAMAHLNFNFVLLNRYDHGAEYMGWHRDDEHETAPTIASLSLGEVRRFRYCEDGGEPAAINLQPGSLVIFDGRMRHQLAKTARQKALRINLTFRQVGVAFGKS